MCMFFIDTCGEYCHANNEVNTWTADNHCTWNAVRRQQRRFRAIAVLWTRWLALSSCPAAPHDGGQSWGPSEELSELRRAKKDDDLDEF